MPAILMGKQRLSSFPLWVPKIFELFEQEWRARTPEQGYKDAVGMLSLALKRNKI